MSAIVLGVLLLNSCHTIKKAADKDKDGFVRIFDGKTLDNWVGDTTYWRVEDSCLVGGFPVYLAYRCMSVPQCGLHFVISF